MSQRARRLLAVVTLLLVFGGIAVADRIDGPASDALAGPPSAATTTAVVAAPGVESSAWYCTGGTSASGSATPTLLLVNHSGRAVAGRVHAVGSSASTAAVSVVVPALGVVRVTPASMVQGGEVAATVVLDGGGVGVWQGVVGPSGWSVAPCASGASSHWSFAQGSTRTGDSLAVVLYNPAATDAVASITLYTSTAGMVAPAAYQGMSVPAGAIEVANVSDHVQNDPAVAAVVSTLSGSVVAAERQVTQAVGLSLVAGNAQETTTNAFALSTDPTGGTVTYRLLDPTGTPARVAASVGLQHGGAAPILLTVPAGGTAVLQTSNQPRIPPDTPYSVVFGSSSPIAVARETGAPPASAGPQVGISAAVPLGRTRWLLPPVPWPGTGVSYLAVVDLAGRPVTVRVRAPGRGGWQPVGQVLTVAPGAPAFVGPNPPAPIGAEPLEVTASGPVAVELDALPAGSPGVVVVPALGLG